MSEVEHAAFPPRYTCTMLAHYEPKRNAQKEPAVTELDPSTEEQARVLLKKCAIVKLPRHKIGQKVGPTWLSKVNQYPIEESNVAR